MSSSDIDHSAVEFHGRITKDGIYKPETGRYVLYVNHACPYANRAQILYALKGLHKVVDIVVTHPVMGHIQPNTDRLGWFFGNETIGTTFDGYDVTDSKNHKKTLREVYHIHNPNYEGAFSVPMLFDMKTQSVVNNNSAEILAIFEEDLNEFAEKSVSIWPADIPRSHIDELCDRNSKEFSDFTYPVGMSKTQEDYNRGIEIIFGYLDFIEKTLSKSRFIAGNSFSEADIRFIPTAMRMKPVHSIIHRIAKKHMSESDYPNIINYLRDVQQNVFNDEARAACSEKFIITLVYSRKDLNPSGIIPILSPLDLQTPTTRTPEQFQ